MWKTVAGVGLLEVGRNGYQFIDEGGFGMQLDNNFYSKYVNIFDECMKKTFGTDINILMVQRLGKW